MAVTTTINPQAEVPSRAAAALSDAQAAQPQSLPQLLAQRNVLVDAANALVDPPNEQLDDAAIGYETVERAIRETPAETVDDVVAKMALVAEFVREQGCPDVDDVEAVLAEARSVLIRACDPMRSENVARRDAHWALAPVDNTSPAIAALAKEVSRRNAAPVETLETIVAEARRFLAEVYEPAHQAFSEADQASIDNKAPEFTERANELNDIWLDHADTFEAIAQRIFNLPAPTPEIARRHVVAYAELVTPYNGEGQRGITDPVKRLNRDDVRLVVDYLLQAISPYEPETTTAGQPFSGPTGDGYAVSPPLPDATTPLAEAVALRDRIRCEIQAYEDEHDADAPQEYQDRLIAAEFGVYRAPAISAAEILWKLGEHLMEDGEGYTHAEAVAAVENTYGLVAAALAGVYRDLEHLAGHDGGAVGRAAASQRWDRAQLLAAE